MRAEVGWKRVGRVSFTHTQPHQAVPVEAREPGAEVATLTLYRCQSGGWAWNESGGRVGVWARGLRTVEPELAQASMPGGT